MPGLVSATITFDGLPVYLPDVLQRECERLNEPTDWVGKANSWRVVRGAEPSRGWLLLTGLQLDAIDLNATDHYLTFKETGELGSTQKWEQLVIVRADAILPGPTPSTETMYLVEIADRRVYGKMTRARGSGQDNHGYNIRTIPSFGQEVLTYNDYTLRSLKTGSPPTIWTWAQLFENLWSGFNLSTFFGAWSDVDITEVDFPASNPENIPSGELVGWDLFNQLLDHIGHTIVPKQNGKWRIIRVGVEETGLANRHQLLVDTGRLLRIKHSRVNSEALMPRYVVVNFPYSSRLTYDGSGTYPAVSTHAWIDNPTFRVLVTTASIFGTTAPVSTDDQTYGVVYDSMTALHDRTLSQTASASFPNDKATNTTLLNARAIEIAEAWLRKNYNQFNPELTHNTYSGYVSSIPNSLVSGLCFYDTGDGLKTDFVFHPYRMDMNTGRAKAPEYDALRMNPLDSPGPPDIGRPHPPTDLLCPAIISDIGTGLAAWSSDDYDSGTSQGPSLANPTWSSSAVQGFASLVKINALYDALSLHFVSEQSVLAMFSQDVNKWIAFAGNQFHHGVVSQGWRSATPDVGYIVSVTPIPAPGSGTDDEITVWIPPCKGGAPNIITGDRIVFARTSLATASASVTRYVCLTEVMDDAVGTVKYMALSALVPDGWAVMNGTDNATANGGSNLDMTGQIITSDGTSSVSDATDYDPTGISYDPGASTYTPATLPLYNLVMIERLDNSDP